MKKIWEKDKRKRNEFKSREKCHMLLKSFSKNNNMSYLIRWSAASVLSDFPDNKYKSNSTVKRCLITGRKSKISKDFNVSRLVFLKLARKGAIPGIKKLNR